MTAVLYDEVVTTAPAPRLTLGPVQKQACKEASKQAPKRPPRPQIGAGGDPLMDAATRLLSIPLREVYAVLWRVGLIEVTA